MPGVTMRKSGPAISRIAARLAARGDDPIDAGLTGGAHAAEHDVLDRAPPLEIGGREAGEEGHHEELEVGIAAPGDRGLERGPIDAAATLDGQEARPGAGGAATPPRIDSPMSLYLKSTKTRLPPSIRSSMKPWTSGPTAR